MTLNFSSFLGFLFFLIPATKIYVVQRIAFLDLFFDIWVVCGVALLCLMVFRRNNKVPKEFNFLLMFLLFYNATTVLNFSDQIMGAFSESCRLFIVPLYLVYILNSHQSVLLKTLERIRKWYLVLLILDNITIFIQLVGINLFGGIQYSLLGLDNYSVFSIVPMITIILWSYYYENGRFSLFGISTYIICLLAKFFTASMGALLSLTMMGILLVLLYNINGIKRFFSAKHILFTMIALLIGITTVNIQKLLEPFLLMMGKDVTLSYRTIIWSKTIKAILKTLKSFIIGYGKTSGDEYKTVAGFSLIWDTQSTHPHNFYLALLFATGIIGFIIYGKMILRTLNRLFYNSSTKATSILISGCSAFFIVAFADDYIMVPYFYTMVMVIALFCPVRCNGYAGKQKG